MSRGLFLGLLVWGLSNAVAKKHDDALALDISPAHIVFADDDPLAAPKVAAQQPVRVRVDTPDSGAWTLTVLAQADLMDGVSRIPIGFMSWTSAQTPPFVSGTMSSVVPQLVGSGVGQKATLGTLLFALKNSWETPPGSYTQSITFSLSSP